MLVWVAISSACTFVGSRGRRSSSLLLYYYLLEQICVQTVDLRLAVDRSNRRVWLISVNMGDFIQIGEMMSVDRDRVGLTFILSISILIIIVISFSSAAAAAVPLDGISY